MDWHHRESGIDQNQSAAMMQQPAFPYREFIRHAID
jgi:hypothetical protein